MATWSFLIGQACDLYVFEDMMVRFGLAVGEETFIFTKFFPTHVIPPPPPPYQLPMCQCSFVVVACCITFLCQWEIMFLMLGLRLQGCRYSDVTVTSEFFRDTVFLCPSGVTNELLCRLELKWLNLLPVRS